MSFSICEQRDSRPTSGRAFKTLEQLLPEKWILVGELEGKCRKDCLKIAPVGEVSRAEEAGPEFPIREGCLGQRLGDGRFSGPGEAVQPEDTLLLFAQSTNVQFPTGHPSEFPSGTPRLFPQRYPASPACQTQFRILVCGITV
jgi:hypothetical protein